MAKKQKKAVPKPAPTKRQLSKWQRQMKIRRIVIIAAAVFVAGIVSWVGHSIYSDRVAPLREVVIKVNDASFTMGYYVDMLEAYTQDDYDQFLMQYMAGVVADTIIDVEVMRQHAQQELGIEVSTQEIQAYLREHGLPDDRVYRDMVASLLLQEKLAEYFDEQLPLTMEQARVQVMLVESEAAAEEVLSAIQSGGNFTALVDEFSYHPQIQGDLGWQPEELMPNPIIADVALNMTAGEIHGPVYDASATKTVGYWLVEVIDAIDEAEEETEVKVRAILLGSRAEAERMRSDLATGNFTAIAQEHSQHESRNVGGELGWLKRGDMNSEAFDEVAFNLTPNRISEPVKDESVQTIGGYWLIDIIARDDARELEPDVREELAHRNLIATFEHWKEESTIENRLDANKKAWAIERVLRLR